RIRVPALIYCLSCLSSSLSISSSLQASILKKKQKGPPGPRPLPVLGNLLQLDLKGPYKTLLEKYGSVFTVYLGPNKVVILAGYRTVKEALVDYDEEFGDAQQTLEMRHFALTKLRDFGMGKRACEDKIIEECQHLIEVFKKFKGKNLSHLFELN
uniref:Uncharacterized protein n=1 Tax=Maylandia zebra TaxID=106582 RepID=A0A3P9C4Y9_9CICH